MSDITLLYFFLALAFFVIVYIPLFQYVKRKRRDIFEPVYIVTFIFLMMFWVRSVYVLVWGSGVLGEQPFPADIIEAWNITWLYLILAMSLFFMSYYSKIGVAVANAFAPLPAEWSIRRTYLIIFILFGVGLAAFLSLAGQFGGIVEFLIRKPEIFSMLGIGPLMLLSYCMTTAACIIYVLLVMRRRRRNFWLFIPLLLIAIAAQAGQGMKGALLLFLFTLLMIYHYLKKPIRLRFLILFSLIAVFIVFLALLPLRQPNGVAAYQQITLEYSSKPMLILNIAIQRFSGIDGLIYIIRDTPWIMDYQLGKTYLPVLYAWIPRELWPDKPVTGFGQIFTPLYLGHVFAPGSTTYAPTIFGEAYVNFHVAGIILVATLGGIFLRAFYHYLIERERGLSSVLVFSTTLPSIMVTLEAHSVVLLTIGYIFFLTTGISLYVGMRRTSRPKRLS
jgi:oligosaccharide repeat unit polymerase